MPEVQHLPNAPIVEAVIDVRAQTPYDLNVDALAQLGSSIGGNYTIVKPIHVVEFELKSEPGKVPESRHLDRGVVGCRYTSGDGRQIAQFRNNGFTFSRLEPYTRWEDIFTEASRLYRIYLAAGQPEEIVRIAVRYINRLILPIGEIESAGRFLTCPPQLPAESGCKLTGFLSRVQVQDTTTGIGGTISQTLDPKYKNAGKLGVILDLDFFERRTQDPSDEVILPRFGALREMKNRYFFASLTPDAVELFT